MTCSTSAHCMVSQASLALMPYWYRLVCAKRFWDVCEVEHFWKVEWSWSCRTQCGHITWISCRQGHSWHLDSGAGRSYRSLGWRTGTGGCPRKSVPPIQPRWEHSQTKVEWLFRSGPNKHKKNHFSSEKWQFNNSLLRCLRIVSDILQKCRMKQRWCLFRLKCYGTDLCELNITSLWQLSE